MSRLEDSGKDFREELLSRNLYTPNDIYDIDNPKIIQAIDSISRLLRPGNAFNFSDTVIGRVIGPQTPITEIGRKALFNLYTEQVKSTIIRKNAPTVNFNNLLRNPSEFITKKIDYSITREDSTSIESKIFDALRYSGVNRLTNPLTSTESTELIKNTGKGQRQALIKNLNKNIFSNNFGDILEIDNTEYITALITRKSNINFLKNKFNVSDNIPILNNIPTNIYLEGYYRRRYESKFYATSGDTINQSQIDIDFGNNIINKNNIVDEDIVSLNNSNNVFTWGKDNTEIRKTKGILGYTATLFNILSTKDNAPFDKTVSSININGKRYYNGIKYGGDEQGERSYNIDNQMNKISKTIKPFGYSRKSDSDLYTKSPIYNRPIPKIVFDDLGINQTGVTNNVMFSIENLAINSINITDDLNEKGPNGGRILWFAPMIENINESVSPNINTTNFLGRGEPVYTYANTERKLTVNFLMIVDHVEELVGVRTFNEFQDRLYNIRSKEITKTKIIINNRDILNKNQENLNNEIKLLEKISIPFEYENFTEISYYFQHNVSSITISRSSGYESNGLNREFIDEVVNLSNKLQEYIEKNPNGRFKITLKGYASAAGNNQYNQKLSEDRANSLKSYLESIWIGTKFINNIDWVIESFGETQAIGQGIENGTNFENASLRDTSIAKRDRRVSILNVELVSGTDEVDLNIDPSNIDPNILRDLRNQLDDIGIIELDGVTVSNIYTLRDEYESDYPIDSFSKIREYKYQNGLISYTPYDLYKRLTFLHQCTRQGSTIESNDTTSNAVFGRPPFIIFRLGDMYNTKAIITGLTIDFENNLPWDINPEGFGVQKMGCRVSLSMNLIGGSSVDYTKEKPISHILNAESRRFYANSRFEAGINDILDKEEVDLIKNRENNIE